MSLSSLSIDSRNPPCEESVTQQIIDVPRRTRVQVSSYRRRAYWRWTITVLLLAAVGAIVSTKMLGLRDELERERTNSASLENLNRQRADSIKELLSERAQLIEANDALAKDLAEAKTRGPTSTTRIQVNKPTP